MATLERSTRDNRGVTITEMMVAAVLLSLSFGVIGELVVLNTMANTKLTNKASGAHSIRTAIERVCSVVRQSRNLGDSSTPSDPSDVAYLSDPAYPNEFPNSANHLYSSSVGPASGWPAAPWPGLRYRLDAQTLIVQEPVLFLDPANDRLSPLYNPAAPSNPLNGLPIRTTKNINGSPVPSEFLKTTVFKVLPDPTKPQEYILQMARFSGEAPDDVVASGTSLPSSINPPQTLAKGIVGPRDPNDSNAPPVVFRYFQRNGMQITLTNPSQISQSSPTGLIGVSIDLEIKQPAQSTSSTQYDTYVGEHGEAIIRQSSNLNLRNNK